MPSRLSSYRDLLEAALRADYSIVSIERFWQLIGAQAKDPTRRYLILRHDIDSDPRIAAEQWQIERSLGIEGSYFFRLSTFDLSLARAIADAGSQVSYHYEELAWVGKRRRLRDPADLVSLLPEAQDRFRTNLERLRTSTGLPMRVVAAHGDFLNRKLGIMNWAMLADRQFRREVGVDLETYDDEFMRHVSSRHADAMHPTYWAPEDPLAAIDRGEPVVYVLVHPRPWRVARIWNARDDVTRLGQELLYRLPLGPNHGERP